VLEQVLVLVSALGQAPGPAVRRVQTREQEQVRLLAQQGPKMS
jgi:hypothetical protein